MPGLLPPGLEPHLLVVTESQVIQREINLPFVDEGRVLLIRYLTG